MKPYSIFLQRNGTYFLNNPRILCTHIYSNRIHWIYEQQVDTTYPQIYGVNEFTYQLFGVKVGKQLVKEKAKIKRPQLVNYGRILKKVIVVQRSVMISHSVLTTAGHHMRM
jgi:hypothetical protein